MDNQKNGGEAAAEDGEPADTAADTRSPAFRDVTRSDLGSDVVFAKSGLSEAWTDEQSGAQDRISNSWRASELIPTIGLLAPISYGAAWIYTVFFFRRFGLTPELAGLGVEFLTTRAAVILVALILVFGVVFMPTAFGDWLKRGRDGDLMPFHQIFIFSHIVLVAASVVLAFVTLSSVLNYRGLEADATFRWIAAAIVAVLLVAAAGTMFLRGVGYEAGGEFGPGLAQRVRFGPLFGAVSVWAILVALFMAAVGSYTAEEVARGEGVGAYTVALGVQPASVIAAPSGEVKGTVCDLVLLGGSNGQIFLYDRRPARTIAYSVETVDLRLGRFRSTLGVGNGAEARACEERR